VANAAPAGLDEGVANLERFNWLLDQATRELDRDRQALHAHEQAFTQLEQSAGERFDQLEQGLGERAHDLASGRSQAEEAMQALSDEALAATESRLAQAQQQVEGSGREVEQDLASATGLIQQGWSALDAGGFDEAASAQDAFDAELDRQEAALESAVAGFEQGLAASRQETEGAETEAEQAIAGLGAEADRQAAEVEAVRGLAAFVSGTFVPSLEAAAETLQDEVGALYAAFASDGESARNELVDGIEALVEEAAGQIEEQGLDGIAGAVESAVEGPVSALQADFLETGTALTAGAAVAEEAASQADQLSWAAGVVAEIDRLLDAMKGQ
jgi:hypothetical protein